MKEMCPSVVPLVLVVILYACKVQQANACIVTPTDPYIVVGSDTTIMCQTSCVPGKVLWTLNNKPINESLSNIINSSHTALSLRNFIHPRAIVECRTEDALGLVLGGTTIRTYSKPSKLACLLHYKDQTQPGVPELFTCSWEQLINSSLDINYTVLVSQPPLNDQSEICTSTVTTCTAKDIHLSGKIHLLSNISVTVRAKTSAWEAYSEPYEFDPYVILKIVPPKLNVNVLSDHLLIKWRPTSVPRKSHCQVKYSKVVSDGAPEFISEKLLNRTVGPDRVTVTVDEKVESCSKYKVSVRCALDNAPWSDWSQEKHVLTKLNKNDINLHLWRTVAKPQENGVRKVHAMWTEIPAACQDTFTYTIKNITGGNYTDSLCRNSTCDIDVNPDAHRIILSVFHNDTLLAEDSVYVPAVEEDLPLVSETHTSAAAGVIQVSWKAPVQPVRGYMIDWTHNGNQYYWKESEYTNTTLFDLLGKKPYNITVTPLFDNRTGHGTQAPHICSSVGDPDNITIDSVHIYQRSIRVSWSTKSLGECSGAIINYTVLYSTQTDPVLNVTVDGAQKNIVLKDLKPDTEYKFYISATALSGTTRSDERHFTTKRFDPRLITELFVSGSIIIIVVLTLGLCCAVQWKKIKEKPLPNPGLSSLALWPSSRLRTGVCPFQSFSNPSESICDKVYTEETQRTSTPPLTTRCSVNPASNQTESDIGHAPDAQSEKPDELLETQHQSCAGESTLLLSSENSSCNPYRSQTSVEAPSMWTSKKSKCVTEKLQEKIPPVTVYVTLNMFEQGQGR